MSIHIINKHDVLSAVQTLTRLQNRPVKVEAVARFITAHTPTTYEAVAQHLQKMARTGELTRVRHGYYTAPHTLIQQKQKVTADHALKARVKTLEERTRVLAEGFNTAHAQLTSTQRQLTKLKELYMQKRDADNALMEALEAL